MKVHKLEVIILDFDDLGADGVRETLENQKFPNYCFAPNVQTIRTAEIGEWSDDHPLNKHDTFDKTIEQLFGK